MSSTPAPDQSSTNNASSGRQRWFPLESNAELINDYVSKLGFDTTLFEFTDVYSIEDWALEMIAQPVLAVLLLYPLTDKQESHRSNDNVAVEDLDKVWFIKQRIGNACGTIGLLHALYNIPADLRSSLFKEGSWLKQFYDTDCPISLDPVRKAEILEGSKEIATMHDQATASTANSTSRGSLEDDLITHFIALVNVNSQLYELDGRKKGPVKHGNAGSSTATLLQDACQVAKTFMERDPGEVRFTILALAPKQNPDDNAFTE